MDERMSETPLASNPESTAGESERRRQIADRLLEGSIDRAAALARESGEDVIRPEELALIDWLLATELPKDRPAAWLGALRMGMKQLQTVDSPIADAVRGHLARGLAMAVERKDGRGSLADGVPVGAYLLEAGLVDEAAASLYATLAKAPANGRAALLLGNALIRLERVEEARDAYRRAFRVAPLELDLAEVEDPEVRELAGLMDELGLEGDPRVWLPSIGLLEDVLPFSALDPVPGAGFGPATRAYDLLIAHKGARSHGERTAIRRDLRELAPELFAALLASRKLDAAPTPTGTA